MKKIIACIYIIQCLLFSLSQANASEEDNYFIVTAYYSPLPNQEFYITGNYEDEIILNGQGIAGASGKKVYSGMLAAPSSYSFGTKIYLEGLGIGSVEDRGGAIVPAGQRGYSHDRIDLWVGYGDEGLRRAMYWGKRKVKGRIVTSTSTETISYNKIPAPSWAVPQVTKLYGKTVQVAQNNNAYAQKEQKIDIFSQNLGKGSDPKYIQELQNILSELGYLEGGSYSRGEYDIATIDAIFDLQIETEILNHSYEAGAGFFGPKTRKELAVIYDEFLNEEQKKIDFFEKYETLTQEAKKQSEEIISSFAGVRYGEISPRVRTLQIQLQKLGVFEYKDTAIFGKKTENAILSFQLKHKIIQHTNDIGAGIVGPNTRKKMQEKLAEIVLLEKISSENLEKEYKTYILDEEEREEKNISSKEVQVLSI